MKPEQDDRLERADALGEPTQHSLDKLQRPEIVGEVASPTLEMGRRLLWRAFDWVCASFVVIRLSIFDRIDGPEAPTPADLKREADHKRLVSALPIAGEAIEQTKHHAGQIRDGKLGTPYR